MDIKTFDMETESVFEVKHSQFEHIILLNKTQIFSIQ